jgi:hypothetical protein
MLLDQNALRVLRSIFLYIPGMAPGAIKRNVLVALFHLVVFGILFSLYFVLGV